MGKQVTVAPGGKLAVGTLQVAATAGSGPLLVQVTVPDTGALAAGLVGKPEIATAISACREGSTMR